MRRSFSSAVILTLFTGLLAVSLSKVSFAAKPLNEKGLLRLIELGTDDSKVVANIQRNGVDFDVTEESLKRLKEGGASDAIVTAVKRSAKPASSKRPAKAVALNDVVELLENGADEATILSLLQRSPTLFTLGAEDEARIRKAGAGNRIIEAMKGKRAKSAQQNDVTDIVIILDCSGSMTERQKEGVPKITSAKKVVSDLVRKIPNGLRLAFIVYGTESKSTPEESCRDIKILRPLSELDAGAKEELVRMIGELNVKGNTPIAESLKIAGRELAKNDAFCGLILISDGKETCNGDPAAEAAELAKNPKFSFGVNVIGLDVHDDERQSLAQIAEKGKGKYYNADSAARLEEAVASLRQELAAKTNTDPEQRAVRETELSGNAAKPGSFLNDAGLVRAGEYKGKLAMLEAHYYKVAVRKGQEVRAIGQIQKGFYEGLYHHNNQTFSISLFDGPFRPLKRESLMVNEVPKTIQTLRATSVAPSDGFVYIGVAASDNTRDDGTTPAELTPVDFKPKPSTYALRIRLGEGADSGPAPAETPLIAVTAGNAFGKAGELTSPSIAAGDIKIGEVVFYKTKVKKGDKLLIAAAVQKPWYLAEYNKMQATYTLTVYDDDQVQFSQKKMDVKNNVPDAQVLTDAVTATLDGQLYFSVTCENSGSEILPKGFQPKPGYLAIQLSTAAEGTGENAAK